MNRRDVGPVSRWILNRGRYTGKDREEWGEKQWRDYGRSWDRMIELMERWPWLRRVPAPFLAAVVYASFWLEKLRYIIAGDGGSDGESEASG